MKIVLICLRASEYPIIAHQFNKNTVRTIRMTIVFYSICSSYVMQSEATALFKFVYACGNQSENLTERN